MKKTLLSLFALLLLVTVANAQQRIVKDQMSSVKLSRGNAALVMPSKKANVPVSKIALDNDERIMGFYDTDELPDGVGDPKGGIGVPKSPGTYKACVILTDEEIGNFVGGEITKMRFAVTTSVGASCVYIHPCMQEGNSISIGEPIAQQEVASTKAGWNEVTLDTPVKIEEGMYYMLAYDYNQNSTDYPLLCDGGIADYMSSLGFIIYGDLGDGEGFYDQSSGGFGNLCIQAVVKGGNFVDTDMSVKSLSLPQFVNVGDKLSLSFKVKNTGNTMASSYTLSVAIDGSVVKTLETPVALTGMSQNVAVDLDLSDDMAAGVHTVTVAVDKINGVAPTENTADDKVEGTFVFVKETLQRQMTLIEQFTSTACPYCPYGHPIIEALKELRSDLAVAVLHNNYPGTSLLGTTETDQLSQILCQGYMNPSAAFNRFYIDDASLNQLRRLVLSLSYNPNYATQVAQMFSQDVIDKSIEEAPAFATVDIAQSYDPDTRELEITVSGDAVDGIEALLPNAALTVYVTEDNIVARQAQPTGGYDQSYVHNDVVRDIVSNIYGDALTFDGNKYSNTYTVTLNSTWKAENMSIVAFVSNDVSQATDIRDLWVTNANKVKLDVPSGIENAVVSNNETAVEVARYALDGTQLSQPTKGVNIVKMSDGTTKKVIVK